MKLILLKKIGNVNLVRSQYLNVHKDKENNEFNSKLLHRRLAYDEILANLLVLISSARKSS